MNDSTCNTCDLLVVFANGKVLEIPDVKDYYHDKNNRQFRFEKDDWISFLPEQNVAYFGKAHENMELEISLKDGEFIIKSEED